MDNEQKILSLLENLDVENLTSWSQIVLLCAIAGIEDTMQLFYVFAYCSILSDSIIELLVDAATTDDNLVKVDAIKYLYELGHKSIYNTTKGIYNKAYGILAYKYGIADNVYYYEYEVTEKGKFENVVRILNAFDKRDPLLQLKFFDKYNHMMFSIKFDWDRWMIKYILERTKLKAKYNTAFKKVLNAIENVIRNASVRQNFLN